MRKREVMDVVYRNHLQICVGAATVIGMAVGWWLCARGSSAGLLEFAVVWCLFVIIALFVFSRIDQKQWPDARELFE